LIGLKESFSGRSRWAKLFWIADFELNRKSKI